MITPVLGVVSTFFTLNGAVRMGTAGSPGAIRILEIHLNQRHRPCMNSGANPPGFVGAGAAATVVCCRAVTRVLGS